MEVRSDIRAASITAIMIPLVKNNITANTNRKFLQYKTQLFRPGLESRNCSHNESILVNLPIQSHLKKKRSRSQSLLKNSSRSSLKIFKDQNHIFALKCDPHSSGLNNNILAPKQPEKRLPWHTLNCLYLNPSGIMPRTRAGQAVLEHETGLPHTA